MKEIKDMIWKCDGYKISGKDKFYLNFIKSYWDIVKMDRVGFVNDFYCSAKVPKAMNTLFFVLITKKLNPQALHQYRPISLIG